MGFFGGGNTKRTTTNVDSRTINDYSGATFDSSVDDNSFTDNSISLTAIDSSYKDNSTFSSSADFTDNSSFTDNSDSSYKDNSVYSSSADYTDKSTTTTNYLDGGAIAAGRDVSMQAIQAVANSSLQLNETYKAFAISTENATDSALNVASNVANANSGGVNGMSNENYKTIGYVVVAVAVVAVIAKKA